MRHRVPTAGQDELVTTHLPVVGHLVAELAARLPPYVGRDDLTGAGVLALVTAARSYDTGLGVPFGAYARARVRGALLDELRAADWASRGARRRSRRLAEESDRLAGELGRPATDGELAHALGVTPSEVAGTRADASRAAVTSLSVATVHEQLVADTVRAAGPDPEEQVAHAERVGGMLAAVAALPPRLRAVVEGYDLGEQPMGRLAAELGVSESRVSQLRAEALTLLRDALDAPTDTGGARSGESPLPAPRGPADAGRRRREYAEAALAGSTLRGRVEAGMRALGATGAPPAAGAPDGWSGHASPPRPQPR